MIVDYIEMYRPFSNYEWKTDITNIANLSEIPEDVFAISFKKRREFIEEGEILAGEWFDESNLFHTGKVFTKNEIYDVDKSPGTVGSLYFKMTVHGWDRVIKHNDSYHGFPQWLKLEKVSSFSDILKAQG